LTFAPGTTIKTVTVAVNGDVTFESGETFSIALNTPSNTTISLTQGTGTGTILNDDAAPTVSIDSVAQNEGDAATSSFVFTVSLTGPTALQATVSYGTNNGTATLADND